MDATSRLLIDLYQSARQLPIPEFQAHAIILLKSVCRIDSAVCATGRIHPQSGVAFHSIFLHNICDEFISAHAEIADQDILASEVARSAGRACVFNLRELMPARKYPAVAAFDARFEMQNMLGQLNVDGAIDSIDGILLWRSKIDDRFSDGEHRLGIELLPHFIEASTLNRLVWLNQLTENTIARRGVRALANAGGVLYTHDAEFIDLLKQEWPDWSPPILPPELTEALRQSPSRRFDGKRMVVSASLTNGMLFLLARKKQGLAGLTPAQLAVARLIANGHSYKEAATELSLSERTIRNHMSAAYARLDLPNKAALARWLNDQA